MKAKYKNKNTILELANGSFMVFVILLSIVVFNI